MGTGRFTVSLKGEYVNEKGPPGRVAGDLQPMEVEYENVSSKRFQLAKEIKEGVEYYIVSCFSPRRGC